MSLELILVMSLSGSFIFLSDFILDAWIKKRFSIRWRYQLLKLAMLFFIIPFPLFQGFWVNVLPFGKYSLEVSDTVNFEFAKDIIVTQSDNMIVVPSPKKIFLIVWFTGFMIVLLTQIISYQRYKKELINSVKEVDSEQILKICDRTADKLKIYRKIQLMKTDIVHSPLTFGVLKPVIVLPDKEYAQDEIQIILLHELIHIQKYDLLFRFLSLLVISMHWFNPLTYLLFKRICFISESDCDEQIVMNRDRDYRILYGNMIIDAATDMSRKQMLTASFGLAGSHKKLLKERLEILMSMNKVKKSARILSVATLAMIFMGGTFTTFAYNEPTVIQASVNDSFEEFAFTYGGVANFNNGESRFTDKNGTEYHLSEDKDVMAICIHDYRAGTFETHKRNSDGSCVTNYYDAECCVKCNRVIVGEFIGSTTLVKCNH